MSEKVAFCQIDAHLDSNPKIRKAGRDGRDIFEFLLRRTAIGRTEGTVPLAYIDPEYLADQLMMTCDEARHGTSRASQAKLIEIDEVGKVVRIVGWSAEWSRQPRNGAERTAAWRAKRAESQGPSDACDEIRHTTSQVTGGDESDAREEKRREEKREGETQPSLGLTGLKQKVDKAAATRKEREVPLPSDWTPRPEERELAAQLDRDCDAEAEEFRDHWIAKGKRFVSWDAAFRTWLRKGAKWAKERGGQTTSQQTEVRRWKEL